MLLHKTVRGRQPWVISPSVRFDIDCFETLKTVQDMSLRVTSGYYQLQPALVVCQRLHRVPVILLTIQPLMIYHFLL